MMTMPDIDHKITTSLADKKGGRLYDQRFVKQFDYAQK